jgi:hypothetical protein
VNSLKFAFQTDAPYKTSDIPWTLEAMALGKSLVMKIKGISWVDPVSAYDLLFNAVGKALSVRFGFHWSTLEAFEETLREDVGLLSHETMLIQTGVKY